ncbi:MAG: thioredoxin family protein [Bacteroidota bacterium]|nr:thioredoxin family protein [Bacteroidota bacterium]
MKKTVLVLAIVMTMAFSDGYSQNRTIQFIDKPWAELLAQAKKENKLIFMDGYASWCGPCKWMSANMFTNDSIADFYNKSFICAHFDMEKGEGVDLRKTYKVRAYPSLLFINSDGEMVHEQVGAPQKVQNYIDLGLTALNPEECLAAYNRKYNSGNYSPEFIAKYIPKLASAYIPFDDILKKYFATQSDKDMFSRNNWNIIFLGVNDYASPQFDFLLKHQKEYSNLYTKDSVSQKIGDVYLNALMTESRRARSDSGYNALRKTVLESGYKDAEKTVFYADLLFYQTRGNREKFLELACKDLDKYYHDDYNMLNNIAWSVYSIAKDPKDIEKALSWVKRSIEIKSEPFNNDTYAALLFKQGKKEEAIKYERIAIDLAKAQKISSTEYEDALKKMEAKN